MSEKVDFLKTRIGNIIQAVKTQSRSGARDIGGAIVTRTGRIVFAAGISDGELNHPYEIVVTDDSGENNRATFTVPAEPDVTCHTVGISYDEENHVIVSIFGFNRGYQLLDKPYGKTLPFSMDNCGDNEVRIARSFDDGETWTVEKFPLPKPENCHGQMGFGVQTAGEMFIPYVCGTANEVHNDRRMKVGLCRLKNIPCADGGFDLDYEFTYRILSTEGDLDILFSNEVQYVAKADGTGYLSFHRNQNGPPCRREYDLDHQPICDFVRCKISGFDQRDYDPGRNGPILLAFGIIRMADGNLLYGSRYYPSEHHRGGNIFMTSRDEGLNWDFKEDYIPWTLDPLQFANTGWGGNPQFYYGPDGTLIHITSDQIMNKKGQMGGGKGLTHIELEGGFALCRFAGLKFEGCTANKDGTGTFSVDVSTITKMDDVYISQFKILESTGLEMNMECQDLLFYSADATKVSLDYKKISDKASIKLKIVLANKNNPYKPLFEPVIEIV